MNPDTQPDERNGLPSASSMQRLLTCAGSFALSKAVPPAPDSEFARSGGRVAAAIHALETGGQIPEDTKEDEMDTARMLLAKKGETFRRIVKDAGFQPEDFTMGHETRFWLKNLAGDAILSGKMDTFAIHNTEPIAIVLDDKSGWKKTPPPPKNMQLKSYALLLVKAFESQLLYPELRIYASTVSRFFDEVGTYVLRDDANPDLSLWHFNRTVQATLPPMIAAGPFETGFKPSAECVYCPARLACPAISHELRTAEEFQVGMSIDARLASMTNDQLDELLERLELIEFLSTAARAEATERLRLNPAAFEHYELRAENGRRVASDINAAFAAMARDYNMSSGEFIANGVRKDALKFGGLERWLWDLKKAQGEKFTLKEAGTAITESLESIITVTTPEPTLKKK